MTMLTRRSAVTDLAPLRYVRSITAPLSPLQARRFTDKFGVTVLNGYGQAEIGEVIGWTAADAKEHPEKIGAVGRPHPGVAIKVVDDDGCGRGTDRRGGRLLVASRRRMAAGYATGGELADRIDADGFVDTGDLARIDAGRLRVDRGPGRRRDQPGRQQGVPRPRRRGAAARARCDRRGRGRRPGRPPRRGARRVRRRPIATSPTTSSAQRAASTSRRTRCRSRSTGSTRCPAPRSGSSCGRSWPSCTRR